MFETGKSLGYPECCVWAFSLGQNFVDAITDLGCAGFTDEQAEKLLASVDHVPCSQCLARDDRAIQQLRRRVGSDGRVAIICNLVA